MCASPCFWNFGRWRSPRRSPFNWCGNTWRFNIACCRAGELQVTGSPSPTQWWRRSVLTEKFCGMHAAPLRPNIIYLPINNNKRGVRWRLTIRPKVGIPTLVHRTRWPLDLLDQYVLIHDRFIGSGAREYCIFPFVCPRLSDIRKDFQTSGFFFELYIWRTPRTPRFQENTGLNFFFRQGSSW